MEKELIEKWHKLTVEEQQKVLEFIESVLEKKLTKTEKEKSDLARNILTSNGISDQLKANTAEKPQNIQDIIREKKEAEKQLLQTLEEEARNYLTNVTSQIFKFDDSKFLEQEVQRAVKRCYGIGSSGYPYYQKGEYVHTRLFNIRFTVPVDLANKTIISGFIDLGSNSFGALGRIGYWLSVELLNVARVIDKAEAIKLSSLRSIFERLQKLDTYPYFSIILEDKEESISGVDRQASLEMHFSYQKK